MTKLSTIDFTLRGKPYESIAMLEAKSVSAVEWIKEYIDGGEGYQPYYPSKVVIEHRYVGPILEHIVSEGFEVSYEP